MTEKLKPLTPTEKSRRIEDTIGYKLGHEGLELYRITFKKDLRTVRECLADVINKGIEDAFKDGIECAARICESAPQRLSSMDMSVRLRKAKNDKT